MFGIHGYWFLALTQVLVEVDDAAKDLVKDFVVNLDLFAITQERYAAYPIKLIECARCDINH